METIAFKLPIFLVALARMKETLPLSHSSGGARFCVGCVAIAHGVAKRRSQCVLKNRWRCEGGATMALEVVCMRRDGFDGDIDLKMDGLPEGVTATGVKIGAGKTRGIMLVSAKENAPRALTNVSFTGQARSTAAGGSPMSFR